MKNDEWYATVSGVVALCLCLSTYCTVPCIGRPLLLLFLLVLLPNMDPPPSFIYDPAPVLP